MAQARTAGKHERWLVPAICLALAAITFAVFGQTLRHEFVNFDDNTYVYENARVAGGLSWKGLAWVFTHPDCSLYHPLTMLSLMADHQFHGLHPGGYHLTNVLLHTASVLLLFLVLRQMTGALWRSAFVAAVFAVHPLRAESVAWVSERKDVLGTFFFMLTLGAYVYYVCKPNSLGRYLVVAAAFVLALLSKPTVVTLPFVLLLLDYWPLQRKEPVRRLLMEKLPLLALAAGACALTVLAADKEVTSNNASISLPARLGNAVVSYAVYLRQMVWPEGLAPFYPRPEQGYPVWTVALSLLLLVLISGGVWALRRKRPWLLAGWLWYLVMLTPMIGIVQMGSFAHADRMTYLPQIGICVALTWLVAEWRVNRTALGGLMTGVLAVLMICAWKQTAYWRDSETLWTHTLACTTRNLLGHLHLGSAFLEKKRPEDAITQFQSALQINPGYAEAHNNLGIAFSQTGRIDEAIAQYQKALQIKPDDAEAHCSLGIVFSKKGKVDDAITQFQLALQMDPDYAPGQFDLGNALLQAGKVDEAITRFQNVLQIRPGYAPAYFNLGEAFLEAGKLDEAIAYYQKAFATEADPNQSLQIPPDYAKAHYNFGNALLQKGKMDEAITQYQSALQINPGYADAHLNIGGILLQKGKADEAIAQFQQELQIAPNSPQALNNLAWLLTTCPNPALRNGRKAVELATQANALTGGENPIVLHTLAAAFAEAGRFGDAVQSAQKAMALARAAGQQDLAEHLNDELKRYEAGLPLPQ